jgi:hypothetical protein
MKFLLEGRKEDLLKKYMGDFDIQVLDAVLNDAFTKSTNYKYADWILDNLEFNSLPLVMEVLELVKQFDRIGKNLEIKDLNQYPDVVELRAAIENYASKSQRKKVESESKRIYEDDRVLVVKPLSHAASCKYGAGTRWCTTQETPAYFDKYTSAGNELYYVIIKELDKSNKFYKMALHKTRNEDTWYDSTDVAMPPREVEMIVLGIGKKGLQSIEDDFKSSTPSRVNQVVKNLFREGVVLEYIEDFAGTDDTLIYTLSNPTLFDPGMAEANIVIRCDEEVLEKGKIYMTFNMDFLSTASVYVDVSYDADSEFTPNMDDWYKLIFLDEKIFLPIKGDGDFKSFYGAMLKRIMNVTSMDQNLVKYLRKDDTVLWNPDRRVYGFTFEKKDGLIGKLVDYIDLGKKGSAIDFLVDSKILTQEVKDGEKIYRNQSGRRITPRGYFSSFFASAIMSGILSYERQGKKFILSKGPNFKAFKEGKLKPTKKRR